MGELDELAASGSAITYTIVPFNAEERIGVDRDDDGHYDRDERDACSDPADPDDVPQKGGCACPADLDGSGVVDFADLLTVLAAWGQCDGACPEDLDDSGDVGVKDLLFLLGAWGPCPKKGGCPADFDISGDVGVKDLLILLGNWGPCP